MVAKFCIACFAGAATSHEAAPNGTMNPDTEDSLNDDELLALAATQLDDAT